MAEVMTKTKVVYFLLCREIRAVKIGTTDDLPKRMATLQCASPVEIELLAFVDGDTKLESALHSVYRDCRMNGEWFRFDDLNELLQMIEAVRAKDAEAIYAMIKPTAIMVKHFRDAGIMLPHPINLGGRPKLPAGTRLSGKLDDVRIAPDQRAKLEREAKAAGLTFVEYVRSRLGL